MNASASSWRSRDHGKYVPGEGFRYFIFFWPAGADAVGVASASNDAGGSRFDGGVGCTDFGFGCVGIFGTAAVLAQGAVGRCGGFKEACVMAFWG